jgi:hypothetical protein
MNGAAVIAVTVLFCYLILRVIRDALDDNRDARERSSFLAEHERNIRGNQLDREAWESEQIGWRQ